MLKFLHNVIVIDDDYISLFLITKIFYRQQITETILPFTNGINALNYLSANTQDYYKLPEIIFVDVNMPDINGWQFLKELNKIKFIAGYKPAIYLISAELNIDFEMLENWPWVKGYLTKPIIPGKLIQLLNSLETEFENTNKSSTVGIV